MTQHWIYLNTQHNRIQVYNLIKTIDKIKFLHTQQKIPIHMLISINNTETYTTSERSIVTSDEGGQAHCFGSFSGHASFPKEINTLFSVLHCLASFFWLFYMAIWGPLASLHMLNNSRWEHGKMASRGMKTTTHTTDTLLQQGMCRKPCTHMPQQKRNIWCD